MCISMSKRFLILLAAVVATVSCTVKTEVIPAFQAGNPVALCRVGASGGEVSVLVETQGQWRVRSCDSWISTDVPGGSGRGAFTFRYGANRSDILNLRPGRVGRIAICLEGTGIADTLLVAQKGFLSAEADFPVTADPKLKLEFENPSATNVRLLVASSEGASAETVAAWAGAYPADIFVLDGLVSGSLDGLNVLGCNFAGLSPEQRYDAFREAVCSSMGSALIYGSDWVICGQMYHYSAMQVGYPQTPSWYPADASGDAFKGDRYAWQNNLYDLLWMKNQGWVETYTDESGHSWQADYVYVSASLLDPAASVETLPVPVPGMLHKPIEVVLKY